MIKKISFLFLPLLFTPVFVFAAKINENKQDKSVIDFLNRTKNVVFSLVGAFALLFIVIGGVKYITSRGNKQQLDDAKKTLTYAILGLILVILSQLILTLITGDVSTSVFGNDTLTGAEFLK